MVLVTAGDLPADGDALRELARLRSPVLVYLVDADFQITFSSDGRAPGPLPDEIDGAARVLAGALEAGEPATAQLADGRILRAERLVGASTATAYVVFIEQVGPARDAPLDTEG